MSFTLLTDRLLATDQKAGLMVILEVSREWSLLHSRIPELDLLASTPTSPHLRPQLTAAWDAARVLSPKFLEPPLISGHMLLWIHRRSV